MNKKPVGSKDSADKLVQNIRRKTVRKYTADEKLHTVLAGLRREKYRRPVSARRYCSALVQMVDDFLTGRVLSVPHSIL